MLKSDLVQTGKHLTNYLLRASKKETILLHKANPIWLECSHLWMVSTN